MGSNFKVAKKPENETEIKVLKTRSTLTTSTNTGW
jgi:hypothetical protein